MDWSNGLILRFLKEYMKHDIIWDPNHPEHKNKSMVMEAWEQLRANLNTEMTVQDLKRKKDALMATYRNLEKKVQSAKENGENYRPSWFCYSLMNVFLHNIYKPRSVADNNEDETKDVLETSCFENSTFEYEDFELPEQDNFIEEKPRLKKQKIEYEECTQSEILNTNSTTITPNQQIVEKQDSDEISLYGELLVTKLRKFDRTNRLIVCNKIDNLLFETELKMMNDANNLHYDPLAHDVPTTSKDQ